MIVLVLGMHRSGTSALTRALTLMGAAVPGTLMQPVPEENELGFWESAEIMESHDRFLTAVGSSWDDMRPLPEAVFEGAPARSCRDELSVLIERARTGQPLLAVKDPRICRLLPLWLRLLAEIGEESCAVLPVRNPLEVAHSLLARNKIERERGLMLWLMHSLAAERQSRAMRRAIVSYADCLAAPREMAEGLARSLGCFDEERVREALPEIEAFWREGLRHHARDDAGMLADPATPGWVRDAYQALLRHPLPLDDLDRLNLEVARAVEGVGRYLTPPPPDRSAEVAELTARISELAADRSRLGSDRDALEQRRVETAQALSREEALRASADAALAQSGRDRETMRSQHEEALARRDEDIAARDGEIGRLTGELTESRALAEDRERRLAEKEAIQSRQTAIIEAQNKEVSREGERIAAALATIKGQTQLLIEKEAALARQVGLTEAKDKEIGRIAREAKRLGNLVLRQERELAERGAALGAEQDRGAALAEDLQSARNDLVSRDRALTALRDETAVLLRRLDDEQRAVALLRQERERVSASIRELEASLDRQRTHLAVLSFMPRGRRG